MQSLESAKQPSVVELCEALLKLGEPPTWGVPLNDLIALLPYPANGTLSAISRAVELELLTQTASGIELRVSNAAKH